MGKIIVSEYVSSGHPDKIADQISDALLDEYLKLDSNSKTGIEVLIKDNVVVLGGEVNSKGTIDYDNVVRGVISSLGFSEKHNLNSSNIKIINLIGKQSPEINKGVEQTDDIIGAGDQGFMVGYASNETPSYLPLGVYLSKSLCDVISTFNDKIGPDVKSQVIVDYSGVMPIVKHILVSTQHSSDISLEEIRCIVKNIILNNEQNVFEDYIYNYYIKDNQSLIIDINPCGSWEIGGPISDCGLTGRKIVVDQYGGYCNVGGGAFSGKDFSKIDRSGSYAARYIAKNIVASGLSDNCKVVVSYMIGIPDPCSLDIEVDTDLDIHHLENIIRKNVDLTPNGITKRFDLKKPIYYDTAKYGHFGNNNMNWEKLDLVETIKDDYFKGR